MDNSLQFKALLAGLFFGIWPLFMNKSGLNGYLSAAAFAIGVSIVVAPIAYKNMGTPTDIRWLMLIIAVAIGAAGLVSYTGVLSKATNANIGTLIAIQVVTQAIVPAIYQVFLDGKISWGKAIGFALAAAGAAILCKVK